MCEAASFRLALDSDNTTIVEETLQTIIKDAVAERSAQPVTVGQAISSLFTGVYYLTLARYFQPEKHHIAVKIFRECVELGRQEQSQSA